MREAVPRLPDDWHDEWHARAVEVVDQRFIDSCFKLTFGPLNKRDLAATRSGPNVRKRGFSRASAVTLGGTDISCLVLAFGAEFLATLTIPISN